MEDFNEKDGMEIISRMINTAREKLNDNGFYFLLWGWTTFVCAAMQYILFRLDYERHYLPWMILPGAATITNIVYGLREDKNKRARTYVDSFLTTLWSCTWFAICLGFALASFMADIRVAFMLLMLLYGLGTLITGVVLKFKPLIFGAVITWLCCVNLIFVDFPDMLLLIIVSITFSYIVPGHILKIKHKDAV